MKERLAKLIDVKSIMTLLLTILFCVLALAGVISGQEFLTIFTVIVGFYFGTQAQKNAVPTANTTGGDPGTSLHEAPDMITQKNVDDQTDMKTRPPGTVDDIVVTGFVG